MRKKSFELLGLDWSVYMDGNGGTYRANNECKVDNNHIPFLSYAKEKSLVEEDTKQTFKLLCSLRRELKQSLETIEKQKALIEELQK